MAPTKDHSDVSQYVVTSNESIASFKDLKAAVAKDSAPKVYIFILLSYNIWDI
jgi:hypothetical protein